MIAKKNTKNTNCQGRTEWGHVCKMDSGHAGNCRYAATAESDANRAAALAAHAAEAK